MSKKKQKQQAKYEIVESDGNGEIKLIQKNNIYYLKFPSHICRALWNQRQKVLSIGIKACTGDALVDAKSKVEARAIWHRACEDAKSKAGYEAIKANYREYNPKNIYKLIGDNRDNCPLLHGICSDWFYNHKNVAERLEETTQIFYEGYLKTLEECPQSLFDPDAIKEWLIQTSKKSPETALRLLSVIKNSLKWAKQKKLLPELTPINTEGWNQEIARITVKRCPGWAEKKGYFKPNQEYRGFSLKDEMTITEEFKMFQWGKYEAGQFYKIVKLKFMTGTRTGEAAALHWHNFDENDINEDEGRFGILHIETSFSKEVNKEKSIKNHKPHQLPCDQELATFLREIRPKNYIPSDYIIEPNLKNVERKNFLQCFSDSWTGKSVNRINYHKIGIMEKLLDEGRLTQPIYRSPYATRHTFINRQINAGVPLGTVAAWVGDNPMTIAKYYLGSDSTRVPVRPRTTKVQPLSIPSFSTQADATNQALMNLMKSQLESQKKENEYLRKQLDEMHQTMLMFMA